MDFFGGHHNEMAYQQLNDGQPKHQANWTHELLGGAAAFAAMKAYEDRRAAEGYHDHAFAREMLAAIAGAEVDKLVETKGMNWVDARRAKEHAQQQAVAMYDSKYCGGQGGNYGPPGGGYGGPPGGGYGGPPGGGYGGGGYGGPPGGGYGGGGYGGPPGGGYGGPPGGGYGGPPGGGYGGPPGGGYGGPPGGGYGGPPGGGYYNPQGYGGGGY